MLAVILVRLLLSPSGAIDRGAFVAGLVILIAAAIGIDRVMGSWSVLSGLASFAFALVLALVGHLPVHASACMISAGPA